MEERYSQGMKILFYVLSVVFPVIGIIIGIVLMTREADRGHRRVSSGLLLRSRGWIPACPVRRGRRLQLLAPMAM